MLKLCVPTRLVDPLIVNVCPERVLVIPDGKPETLTASAVSPIVYMIFSMFSP